MVSTSPTAAEAQAGEASALRAGDTGVLGRGSRQPQPSPHPRPLPAPSGLINVWPQRRESQEAKQKRTPLYCWGPGDASYLGRSPRPLRHTRHPGLPAHSLCDHRAHSPSLSLGFLICKVEAIKRFISQDYQQGDVQPHIYLFSRLCLGALLHTRHRSKLWGYSSEGDQSDSCHLCI